MTDRLKYRVFDKKTKTYINEGFEIRLEPNGNVSATEYYDDSMGGCGMNVLGHDDLIVEFCTGRKDKNGTLIFEGDNFQPDHENEEEGRVVVWDDNSSSFKVNCYGKSEEWNGLYDAIQDFSELIDLEDFLDEEIIVKE